MKVQKDEFKYSKSENHECALLLAKTSVLKTLPSLIDKDLKAFMYPIILKLGITLFLLCLAGGYAYIRTLTPIIVIHGNRSLETEYICMCYGSIMNVFT